MAGRVLQTVPVGDTERARSVWLDRDIAWVGGGYEAVCPLRRVDLGDSDEPVDLGCVADLVATDLAFAGDRMAIARGAAGVAVGPRVCAVTATAAGGGTVVQQ